MAVEPVGAETALVHAVDVAMDDAGASRTIRRTGGLELLQRLLLETPPLPAPRPKRASGRVLHLRLTEQALELKRLDAPRPGTTPTWACTACAWRSGGWPRRWAPGGPWSTPG